MVRVLNYAPSVNSFDSTFRDVANWVTMKTSLFASASAFLAAAVILSTPQSQAETHFVSVDGSGFSPSTVDINTGDTVVWVNNDETFSHTTTSDLPVLNPDYWNGLLVDFEDTYSKTFNNVGTFTYHDQLDIGTGTVNVTAPVAPVITLASPRIEAGLFLFEATGLTVGKTNVLEQSSNLVQWVPVSTNIAVTSSMTFTNPASAGPRLFRVFEQP
jgi:plastocyanin